MGQSPDAGRISADGGGLPFLQGCAEFGAKHPTAVTTCNPPLRVAPEGSVLISVRAPVGTMNLADQAYCIGRGLGAFKAKEGLADTIFLKHAVELGTPWLHRRSQGSTFAAISADDLRRLSVPDFSPSAQRRIAAILTSLDTAIEATEALIAKHQQIRSGLLHDLLTRGVADGGSLRRSALEAPDLYVLTKIGLVPVGWEVTGLQAKQRGADKWIRTGPFGSSLNGEHWMVEGCPVVTIGSLGEGVFDEHELLFVGERDAARLAEFRLKPGDVVFSRVADVGRSVVVRQENVGWIMSSNLMRIAVDTSQVRPDFLQMLLAGDPRVKAQIRAKVNSGGREVANSEILGQLLFAWPPVDEQERIIERVQSIEAPIRLDQDQLRKLRMQKQGLMQDLLTGKVPVRAD